MAYSARQCFEGVLTELSKTKTSTLLLEDFNYLFNKALNLYINKRYNIYDVNLQTTDDLRVLKATALLKPTPATAIMNTDLVEVDPDTKEVISSYQDWGAGKAKIFGGTFEVMLPKDYLHILNCICIYTLDKRYKCYNKGDQVAFAATRLTADAWSTIINDFFNRPKPQRPYYYIHNVNTNPDGYVTNPYDSETGTGTDLYEYVKLGESTEEETVPESSTYKRTVKLDDEYGLDLVDRTAYQRTPNSTGVRCEIRYGRDTSVFRLVGVSIDYIKAPLQIRLTLELIDLTEDTSLILEFPDYVCLEIINELVTLIMEQNADPRTLTHQQVTQSIALPTQQLAQTPQLA